jgi:NADH dehydrogenase [ubiquinone] 1 alpha subcomplex assembly factor 1
MAGHVLFDFALADACAGWYSIDDPVMGGVSSSRAEWTSVGAMRFAGVVSLENNGGFASIRSAAGNHDLVGCGGLALRVKGDGKTYRLNLKPDDRFDGLQYQAAFRTSGAWEDIRLPFAAFEPRFRGRPVPDAPVLNPSRVASVGLLISDRQAGPFTLEIERIEVY